MIYGYRTLYWAIGVFISRKWLEFDERSEIACHVQRRKEQNSKWLYKKKHKEKTEGIDFLVLNVVQFLIIFVEYVQLSLLEGW